MAQKRKTSVWNWVDHDPSVCDEKVCFFSGNSFSNRECSRVVFLMCRQALGTNTGECSHSHFFTSHQRLKSTPAKHWQPQESVSERWHGWNKMMPGTWTAFKSRIFAGCCCAGMHQNDILSPEKIPQVLSQYWFLNWYQGCLVLKVKIFILYCKLHVT